MKYSSLIMRITSAKNPWANELFASTSLPDIFNEINKVSAPGF